MRPEPPPGVPSPKLTQLTLFLPARAQTTGQLFVFLRQLQLAVVEAGPAGQALLGQAPVGGQLRVPVYLELLELDDRKAEKAKSVPAVLPDQLFQSHINRHQSNISQKRNIRLYWPN